MAYFLTTPLYSSLDGASSSSGEDCEEEDDRITSLIRMGSGDVHVVCGQEAEKVTETVEGESSPL